MGLFVCLCLWSSVGGEWVNHTGITDTWQKDIVSAQYEGAPAAFLKWVHWFVMFSYWLLSICVLIPGTVVVWPKNTNKYDRWYLYSPRSVQPVCIILSRLAMVYIHPMNLWSFNGQWATGNLLDRFDSFMAYELQSFIFIHHLNSNLFVYPGASHRLLDRLGLSWWV